MKEFKRRLELYDNKNEKCMELVEKFSFKPIKINKKDIMENEKVGDFLRIGKIRRIQTSKKYEIAIPFVGDETLLSRFLKICYNLDVEIKDNKILLVYEIGKSVSGSGNNNLDKKRDERFKQILFELEKCIEELNKLIENFNEELKDFCKSEFE